MWRLRINFKTLLPWVRCICKDSFIASLRSIILFYLHLCLISLWLEINSLLFLIFDLYFYSYDASVDYIHIFINFFYIQNIQHIQNFDSTLSVQLYVHAAILLAVLWSSKLECEDQPHAVERITRGTNTHFCIAGSYLPELLSNKQD